MNKKTLVALLAGAAMLTPAVASAQVAGNALVSKIRVVMGTKAFRDGYDAVDKQNAPQITRAQQLQTELGTLSKPFDSNNDGGLSGEDTAWVAALQQLDVVMKSLDANKDNNLTGTELDQFRAKNLPAQQIATKQQELEAIQANIQLGHLYVVDSIDKQYDAALKSVVTAKKINAVFAPDAFAYAPKEMDITPQVVAVIDRALPVVQFPAPENFTTSREAINMREQIDRLLSNAVASAQRAQQQQQPGAAPAPGQPAAPAAQPPAGEQPDSR